MCPAVRHLPRPMARPVIEIIMSDPSPDKPARRPRYSGANPRRFDQKYKELQPERYAADVAKVLDAAADSISKIARNADS